MNGFERPLIDITRVVWKTTLGLEVSWLPERPLSAGEPEIRAAVDIRGAWTGALTLSCPGDLARRAAAAFFGRPTEEMGDDEARDAVGELANMTCGNLKALLPGPSALSTPRAGAGRAPGALLLTFVCWPQFFGVELEARA